MSMKDFEEYLQHKKLRPATIYNLLIYVRRFLQWFEKEGLTPGTCTYNDLLSLVKKYRDAGFSPHNLNSHLRGIRHYYQWKEEKGEATYNPALNLTIKGCCTKLPGDFLSRAQMEQMYTGYQGLSAVQKRNKVIIGFLVYQGLSRDELQRLEPSDLHLGRGTVFIRRNPTHRARMLPLAAGQVIGLQEYLTKARLLLLALKGISSERLVMTTGESAEIKNAVEGLLKELRKKHPFLKDFKQIRNSVIYHWAEEKNIREAQYLAGHGSIYSTQRYKQANLGDLQKQLGLYHPLR